MKRYRDDAAIFAAQRADQLLAAGDVEGQVVWKRIVEAILSWQRESRGASEAVN